MNNNKIKIILTIFLLLTFNVESYQDFKCSLQCTGKTCGKNIEALESCAKTCPPAEYQQCWLKGLETLSRNPNVPADRKSLISLLKSYLNSDRNQNSSEQPVTHDKHQEARKPRTINESPLVRLIADSH